MPINSESDTQDPEKLLQIIKGLQDSGQTGLALLILALIVVVAAGSWLIWAQQQAMKSFEITAKVIDSQLKAAEGVRQESRAAIEAQIKAADTIREESRKAQDIAHWNDAEGVSIRDIPKRARAVCLLPGAEGTES